MIAFHASHSQCSITEIIVVGIGYEDHRASASHST